MGVEGQLVNDDSKHRALTTAARIFQLAILLFGQEQNEKIRNVLPIEYWNAILNIKNSHRPMSKKEDICEYPHHQQICNYQEWELDMVNPSPFLPANIGNQSHISCLLQESH